MTGKTNLHGGDGGTMSDFGQQRNRWLAPQGATTVMPQIGSGLFQSPVPTVASENPPSYTPQFHPSVQMNDLYAIAPSANPFAGYNQQTSLDTQTNNPYTLASGAYGGQHMVGHSAFSSGSDPFVPHTEQQPFPDAHASGLQQFPMTSDVDHGAQVDSPFASDPSANLFAAHSHIPSSDTRVGNHDQYALDSGTGYGMQADSLYAFGNPFAAQTQQTSSLKTNADSHDQYAMASRNCGMQMDNSFAMNQGANQTHQVSNKFADAQMGGQYLTFSEGNSGKQSTASSEVRIKREHSNDDYSPGDIAVEDDLDEEISKQPGKKRKVNKNGRTRKVREPRGHLRRWDENEVTRALMGIVWACGENGVVIPFGQAAKIVDQDCTSGALQQAILKMHDKLNKEGAQLPRIKMNWPKKPNAGGKSVVRDNGKVPRKKPTCTQATQCNIVSLPARPCDNAASGHREVQGDHFPDLHHTTDTQARHAQLPHRPAMLQVATTNTSTQAGAPSGLLSDLSSTKSPYEAQKLQCLPMTNPRFTQPASRRGNDDPNDTMLSSPRQIPDLAPSTPVQPRRSPVCPPAPRPPTAAPQSQLHLSTGATNFNQRFPLNDAASPVFHFDQQRAPSYTQRQGPNHPTNQLNRRPQQGRTNNTQLGPLSAFNADFEQRNASDLAQRPSSSNMRSDASSMPRNAAFAHDATLTSSPMSGRFQADGSPQILSDFADLQSTFPMDETSRPSGHASSTDELYPRIGAFAAPRKDSFVFSGTQSASSSQDSAGSTDNPYQAAHQLFQQSRNVVTERSGTITPSRAMWAYHSHQQPRQQISLGLETVSNPFGGTFGDALGDPFLPARVAGDAVDYPFGSPTTAHTGMDSGDL